MSKLCELIVLTEKLTKNLLGMEGNIKKIKDKINKQETVLYQLSALLDSISDLRRDIEIYRSEVQLENEDLKNAIEIAWGKLPHIPYYTRHIRHKKGTRSFEVLGEEEFYYDYLSSEEQLPLWCIELCSILIDEKNFGNGDRIKNIYKELLFLESHGLVIQDSETYLSSNGETSRSQFTKATIDEVLQIFTKKMWN